MLTRSKVDYSKLKINDLINWQCYTRLKRKPNKSKHAVNNVIKPDCKNEIKIEDNNVNNVNALQTVMLFDLESYKIDVTDANTHKTAKKWIPHQIAWEIYLLEDENSELKFLDKKNFYVSDMWINSAHSKEINDSYPESFKEHFARVSESNCSIKSGYTIINEMLNDIEKYNVKTIASYNINSDFEALKDLKRYMVADDDDVTIDEKKFDCKYSNPFRFSGINYCDLMHNIGVLYIDYLIKEGLKDEKIFRNATTNQIKLTGRDNSKSIYSAEYVLKKFFDDKQPHTADEDVKLEIKMLQKMIKDYGHDSIELNVMYPNNLYFTFVEKIIGEHSQQIKTAYMYNKKDCNTNTTHKTKIRNPHLQVPLQVPLQDTKESKNEPCKNETQ